VRRRPTAPAPARRWTAILDDGREVPVAGLVVLGRNPQPRPGEETAQLVKLADETRTVSKSHLALDVDHDGLFVVDRGSTNGSTVTAPDGATTTCEPGRAVHVTEGSVVSMGDHWLTVRQD
jgi:pSer/pThr/pTyr-binding forkhead associated (FHA) protein